MPRAPPFRRRFGSRPRQEQGRASLLPLGLAALRQTACQCWTYCRATRAHAGHAFCFRFPNPPQVILGPLSTITDPYLNLFRGIIPPLGGTIDLSPILAFVVLDVSAATAPPIDCSAALPTSSCASASAHLSPCPGRRPLAAVHQLGCRAAGGGWARRPDEAR